MDKQTKSYDKIATRLSQILLKLNGGEALSIEELAIEFGVDKRTIQRDLRQRLEALPIKKEGGRYSLEDYALGQLCYEDIKNFAKVCGVKSLYPSLSNDFIRQILRQNSSIHTVKSFCHEDLKSKAPEFETLSKAISSRLKIGFRYKNKERKADPYKLVNKNGIWYLAADEDGTLKNYTFGKISALTLFDDNYAPNPAIISVVDSDELDWFSQNSFEAVVRVNAQVAEYFLRRKLFPSQQIIEQTPEYLNIAIKVSYDDELLGAAKYWLPNLTIISPPRLQQKLNEILSEYLKAQSD